MFDANADFLRLSLSPFFRSHDSAPPPRLTRPLSPPDFGWDDFKVPISGSDNSGEFEDISPPKSPISNPFSSFNISLTPPLAPSPPMPDPARVKDPDRQNLHHRLEVIEHRIQSGQDTKHLHPAMAVSVLQSHKPLTFTKSEAKMARRYGLIHETQTIPKFWTRRPWDSPNEVMDVESSLNLKSQIRTASRAALPPKKIDRFAPDAPPKKRIVRQKPKPKPEPVREEEIRPRPPPPSRTEGQAPHPKRIESQTPRGCAFSEELLARMDERFAFRLTLPADLYGTDASCDETDGDVF
jgi:hypothetical protein